MDWKSTRKAACLVLLAWLPAAIADAQSEGRKDSLAALDAVAKDYKIEIVAKAPEFPVKTQHGVIEGKAAESKSLHSYVGLFIAEFRLHPADLVRRANLKRVVLCEELSFAGQRRNAIPDYEHDTLYLDVGRGSYSKPYLRKVLHHEFFHIIDYRDDGLVYEDRDWAALNPADFKYGDGGRNAQDLSQTSVLTTKYPGFLNHYSTTGVEEDKAEVFANLLVDPAYVEGRAKNDRVLNAKVTRMKSRLAEFCPAMNAEYWEKVRTRKRSDN